MELIYRDVTPEDIAAGVLDDFVRHQVVTKCWRPTPEGWALLPIAFVDDWDGPTRQNRAQRLQALPAQGGRVIGAFEGRALRGYIALNRQSPDCPEDTLEVLSFHVSEPFRHQGIGGRLFALAVAEGRRRGARRLYISAHSAMESQAAYRKYGCAVTEAPLPSAVKKEPCDVQMEYLL